MSCMLFIILISMLVFSMLFIILIKILGENTQAKYIIKISSEDANKIDPEMIFSSVKGVGLPFHALNHKWKIIKYIYNGCFIIISLVILALVVTFSTAGMEGVVC